jgi:hypothetical protein
VPRIRLREFWESMNGQQWRRPRQARPGAPDHHRPAAAAVRFIAGADAIAQAEEKLAERRRQIDAYRELSSSLALEAVQTA